MNARVFIHPRCMAPEFDQDALVGSLEAAYGEVSIHEDKRGRYEVVRSVDVQPYNGVVMLERMDGAAIAHRVGPAEPEVA